MKVDEKKYTILMNTLRTIAILFLSLHFINYASENIKSLFFGFVQIFAGLNEIYLSKQTDSSGKRKWNIIFGIALLGIGVTTLLKVIYKCINL